MQNKPIPFETECEHPQEAQFTRVIGGCVNVETTVIACRQCGTDITQPKTDC